MKYFIMFIVFMLSGCGTVQNVRQYASEEGAKAMTELRATSEFALCYAISVGEWRRAYGSNQEKAQAYKTLCEENSKETP